MSESPHTSAVLAAQVHGTALRPDATEVECAQACEAAKRMGLASFTVRPCDIDVAARILGGSSTSLASTVGFPHGNSNTGVKLYEARDLLRRGAREIEMVINIAKLRSRQFQHVDMELLQMVEACRKEGAKLRVTLESGYLSDELKIVACRMCGRAEVPVVKTATGFGPTAADGDVALFRAHLPEETAVEAWGMDTVALALAALERGATRLATAAPAALLEEWARQNAMPAVVQPLVVKP